MAALDAAIDENASIAASRWRVRSLMKRRRVDGRHKAGHDEFGRFGREGGRSLSSGLRGPSSIDLFTFVPKAIRDGRALEHQGFAHVDKSTTQMEFPHVLTP